MNSIVILSLICIIFELYQLIIVPLFLQEIIETIKERISWSKLYDKLYKSYLDLGEAYLAASNSQKYTEEELSQFFDIPSLFAMSDILRKALPHRIQLKHNTFMGLPVKHLIFYLLHAVISLMYFIFFIVLLYCMPPSIGIFTAIFMVILSYLTYRNQNNNQTSSRAIQIIDNMLCIMLYIIIIYLFR